jgi:hypothetical protein
MHKPLKIALVLICVFTVALCQAQHLWWRVKPIPVNYTCIYGEIEVLSDGPGIYYCGCNWWPGAEAGGYTGIQTLADSKHVMIFSIWDSDAEHQSLPVDWATGTEAGRFGGEGVGARTIRPYNWRVGKTYRYFAIKRQSAIKDVTLTSVYFFDESLKHWVSSATISSPNLPGHGGIGGFGGGLNAFLENFAGKEKDAPKLALYRLWMGTSVAGLSQVTEASGDGMWGVLNGSFYLAQGEESTMNAVINGSQIGDSLPQAGKVEPLKVGDRKLPPELVKQLEALAKG